MEFLELLEALAAFGSAHGRMKPFTDFAKASGILCIEFQHTIAGQMPQKNFLYRNTESPLKNSKNVRAYSSVRTLTDGSLYTLTLHASNESPLSQEELELLPRVLLKQQMDNTLSTKLEYNLFHEAQMGFYTPFYGMRILHRLVGENKIEAFAVMFFNITNLGRINSMIGRDNGSIVVKNFVKKAEACLREPEVLWRFGGDNFGAVVLKQNLPNVLGILRGSDTTFSPKPKDVIRVSAATGVYECTDKSKNPSIMLDHALSCMNMARFTKRAPVVFYDKQTENLLNHMKSVENDFEFALENKEFVPFFQPKVSLENNSLVGAEQLCRWIKQDGSLIPPGAFIPVLERSKRVCQLDFFMLERLCVCIKDWIDKGFTLVPVSTNFSRMHLGNQNLAQDIINIIDKYNVPHNYVVIEVTETTTENDTRCLKELVFTLKKHGISCSVDDFGVGYSSMALIRDVPFSDLKIDKSFLDFNNDTRSRNTIMMQHVISMAGDLGMSCIAEGAETKDHIELLKKIGCFKVQGYFFDKPLPIEAFEMRLKTKIYPDVL